MSQMSAQPTDGLTTLYRLRALRGARSSVCRVLKPRRIVNAGGSAAHPKPDHRQWRFDPPDPSHRRQRDHRPRRVKRSIPRPAAKQSHARQTEPVAQIDNGFQLVDHAANLIQRLGEWSIQLDQREQQLSQRESELNQRERVLRQLQECVASIERA